MSIWLLVKEPLKRLAFVVAALSIFLTVPSFADPAVNPKDIYSYATSLTQISFSLIQTDSGTGDRYRIQCTVFQVAPYYKWSLILSAGHCATADVAWAVRKDNTLDLLSWSKSNDDIGYDAAYGTSTAPFLAKKELLIRTSPLNPGEKLYQVGFGKGKFSVHSGVYLGQGKDVLSADILNYFGIDPDHADFGLAGMDSPIEGGSSGSAVLDSEGNLVGILVYGFNPIGSPDVMGFTSIDHILKVIDGTYPPK
jgi:hypothetical protein